MRDTKRLSRSLLIDKAANLFSVFLAPLCFLTLCYDERAAHQQTKQGKKKAEFYIGRTPPNCDVNDPNLLLSLLKIFLCPRLTSLGAASCGLLGLNEVSNLTNHLAMEPTSWSYCIINPSTTLELGCSKNRNMSNRFQTGFWLAILRFGLRFQY